MHETGPSAPAPWEAREELVNTLTHGFGLLASLAAGAVLVTLAALTLSPAQLAGATVYALSLVVLYGASTLFHAVREPRWKRRLQVFDHCAIFGLIAGTYTPFTLVSLRGGWGWGLLIVAWSVAVVGIIGKLFLTGRFRGLSTLLYLAMGWMAVLAIGPLREALPTPTLLWLVAGGIAYTLGTPFYLARRLPYSHALWHVMVLVGSACHFAAVLQQVLAH